MLTCSACLRRAFQSLLNDLPQTEPLLLTQSSHPLPVNQTRAFSATSPTHGVTLRSLSKGHHRRSYAEAKAELASLPKRKAKDHRFANDGVLLPNARRNKAHETPVDRRNRVAREKNAQHLLVPDEKRKLEIAAKKEAEWINDPLRLAQRVVKYLREENQEGDGFNRALELVRQAGRNALDAGVPREKVNHAVSWNHLMDWCMEKNDPKTAMKVYNEMKKRGNKPDTYTYTLMLRGFADNIKTPKDGNGPNVVMDALKVYYSISAPNSEVKANTVHLNAMAHVCARALDMDSLWSVIGKANERGPGSPDVTTYTVILNAIQKDIVRQTAKVLSDRVLSPEDQSLQADAVLATGIVDGRKIWADVVARWKRAEINVDEGLVCAMGRLLLLSKEKSDIEDIFQLVRQTMHIAVPSQHTLQRRTAPSDPLEQQDDEDVDVRTVFQEAFPKEANWNKPVQPVEGTAETLFARPSNNTLSMLLEAATASKTAAIGKVYWEVLTSSDKYAIKPDSQNVAAYLRLLRISRSSAAAVEVLRTDWPQEVKDRLYTRGNFVIAMSTCVRNLNNPNVFENASRIVDLMQDKADNDLEVDEEDESLITPANTASDRRSRPRHGQDSFPGQKLELDPKVITMYLNLAMYTTNGFNARLPLKKLPSGDLDFERDFSRNNTFRALKRLGSSEIINIKRMMNYRLEELEKKELSPRQRLEESKKNEGRRRGFINYNTTQERLEDLVGLMKAMVSAYDRTLSINRRLEREGTGPLAGGWVEECRFQRVKLITYLGQIDKKTLAKMELGRSGLWEGYEKEMKESGREGSTDVMNQSGYAQPDESEFEPRTDYGAVDGEGRLLTSDNIDAELSADANEDTDSLLDDMRLGRTPGKARMRKEVDKRVKQIATQREHAKKWLSRRQAMEWERMRREDRRSGMGPDERARKEVEGMRRQEEAQRRFTRRKSTDEYPSQAGWGGGFGVVAREMGREEGSGFLDVEKGRREAAGA